MTKTTKFFLTLMIVSLTIAQMWSLWNQITINQLFFLEKTPLASFQPEFALLFGSWIGLMIALVFGTSSTLRKGLAFGCSTVLLCGLISMFLPALTGYSTLIITNSGVLLGGGFITSYLFFFLFTWLIKKIWTYPELLAS